MRRLFAFFLLSILTFALFQPARAQAKLDVADLSVEHDFGNSVHFKARLTGSAPIVSVTLLFRAQGEANTRAETVSLSPEGLVDFTYDVKSGPIRPFARVDYSFRAALQGGEQVSSATFSFNYDDNRFPWQTTQDGNLRVHWYAGDAAFGQDALDTARGGLKRTGEMLAVTLKRPLDIYVYAAPADLQSALEVGGLQAVGGHASPDLGVGLVAIATGAKQGLEMDRKIPHELAHLLTYELTGENYSRLPVWLREGIASAAELSPNPDYPRALDLAVQQHTVIPLTELCNSFPPEMARIFLAYAESASFTRYLVQQYGTSGLVTLTRAYADGLDCEQGAIRALSMPLSQVENGWRTSVLGEDKSAAALQNLFPYLMILSVMLVMPLISIATWKKAA
jgi:hypothetical protein